MAKAKKSTKKKGRVISADFTKVEDGGGRVRLKEGDYPVKINSIEMKDSQAGNSMLVFKYEFLEAAGKKAAGKTILDRIALTEKAMWRLRNLLQALGKDVPKKVVKLNIDGLIGEEMGITLEDDEYGGKISSKVSDYLSIDDLSEDDEDEDEDSDDEDEDDDDSDDDEDEDEDEDLDEVDLEDEI